MRITDNIRIRSQLGSVQNATRKLYQTQAEVASGKKVTKPSDAPSAAREIMLATKEINLIQKYQDSIKIAEQRLALEEAALNGIEELLIKAKEIAVGESSSNRTATTRSQMKAFVDQLIKEAIAIGHTRHGSAYIFGGTRTNAAPFDSNNQYVGAHEKWKVEVKKGITIEPNHTGQEILLDSGVLEALQNLSDALGNNDVAAIQAAMNQIDRAMVNIHNLHADIGVKMQRIETMAQEHEDTILALTERRSSLEDADLVESINRLLARENALQAAMLAISRATNLSLANFLY